MTKKKNDYTIKEIMDLVKSYLNKDLSIIEKAYNYVLNYLEEDELKNILNIASILTTIYSDQETIAASFLYRLFIDEKVSRSTLEENFDVNIVKLAYGIYKLNKITLSTENDYLVEYYKKVIVGMSEDVRVITVSLSERVNIMRSLSKYDTNYQKKIAKETLEIFAPIAHHLGIYKLKSELEDLSLRYLKPEVYYDIVEKLNSTKVERDNIINEMMNEVSHLLTDHNIEFEIKGRSKSIYSIYNKLDKGRKFSDIYDLLALRILVNNEQECYLVLGLIHSKFKPIAKRFKDFIAMPKSNGYQSLHTTVFGVNNDLFEIQIRTHLMNEVAENGLASHWSYKENRQNYNLSSTDAKLGFFKAMIDMNQQDVNDETFYNSIKEDSQEDNIYVFTPKGDVFEMPKGSTPVDFAYRVHSKVGDTMIGALVNNMIVPLNYLLQDGDVVKINTSKSSQGPSLGWLDFVKLTQTKNKIKSFFTKSRKEELIALGKEMLDKELRKRKIIFNEFYQDSNIKKILKELKIKDLESVYINIGNNKFNPRYVINIIYKEIEEKEVINKYIPKNELDINVSGLSDVKVNIASCCKPIPGDKIIGYITKNNGITIHRDTCRNLIHLDDRIIDVQFNLVTKNKYQTTLLVSLKNNQSRIGDILNKITSKGITIDSVNTLYNDQKITYKISLYIANLASLEKLIIDISKLRYVYSVERE